MRSTQTCFSFVGIYSVIFVMVNIFSVSVQATTKGLSQIVTPDLQKPSDFSLSYQAQSPAIGNPDQLQAELGLTPWLEAAVFKGFYPNEFFTATEVGLIQHEPYLLSTGFLNLSSRGSRAQPFLESGYYTETNKWMAGGIFVENQTEFILGWAYDFNPHWRFQFDFQSGADNFSTIGFTYTLNDHFQFNPALYISNDDNHDLQAYAVLTYSLPLWRARKNGAAPTEL
jgi:hypothetical protein